MITHTFKTELDNYDTPEQLHEALGKARQEALDYLKSVADLKDTEITFNFDMNDNSFKVSLEPVTKVEDIH